MNSDTGDGSRRPHERMFIVHEQEQKLEVCIRSIRGTCTEYELIGILARVVGSWLHGISKYGVRRERHGDDNTPGDLESPNAGAVRAAPAATHEPLVGQEVDHV
jgi:hypothetical protein